MKQKRKVSVRSFPQGSRQKVKPPVRRFPDRIERLLRIMAGVNSMPVARHTDAPAQITQ